MRLPGVTESGQMPAEWACSELLLVSVCNANARAGLHKYCHPAPVCPLTILLRPLLLLQGGQACSGGGAAPGASGVGHSGHPDAGAQEGAVRRCEGSEMERQHGGRPRLCGAASRAAAGEGGVGGPGP